MAPAQEPSSTASPRMMHPRSPMLQPETQHHRAPSLGEIQQHGEEESEAQYNRLRHLMRVEQERLATLQQSNGDHDTAVTSPHSSHLRDVFIDEPISPALRPARSPLSRHSSTSTQPLTTTRSADEAARGELREEGAFYAAMKAMIERENAMLRERIRSLERELSDVDEPRTEAIGQHTTTAAA